MLVFMPFALPGLEGTLFVPLGIAFSVSTLGSLLVSVTVIPVLSLYLLPRMTNVAHGDIKVLAWLKARCRGSLQVCSIGPRPPSPQPVRPLWWRRRRPRYRSSRPPLPPCNEGKLPIGLRLNPGVTLDETSALAHTRPKS